MARSKTQRKRRGKASKRSQTKSRGKASRGRTQGRKRRTTSRGKAQRRTQGRKKELKGGLRWKRWKRKSKCREVEEECIRDNLKSEKQCKTDYKKCKEDEVKAKAYAKAYAKANAKAEANANSMSKKIRAAVDKYNNTTRKIQNARANNNKLLADHLEADHLENERERERKIELNSTDHNKVKIARGRDIFIHNRKGSEEIDRLFEGDGDDNLKLVDKFELPDKTHGIGSYNIDLRSRPPSGYHL